MFLFFFPFNLLTCLAIVSNCVSDTSAPPIVDITCTEKLGNQDTYRDPKHIVNTYNKLLDVYEDHRPISIFTFSYTLTYIYLKQTHESFVRTIKVKEMLTIYARHHITHKAKSTSRLASSAGPRSTYVTSVNIQHEPTSRTRGILLQPKLKAGPTVTRE